MSLSQLEQESKFKKHLGQYWSSKGITQIKIPQIGGQQLNLFKLYKAVCKKGGGQAVSHNKLWKQIVDEFGLPSTCTSASFTLKNHYQKYLLGYQQRFFFGKDDNADLPELVAGRQRKPMKDGETMMMGSKFGGYRHEGEALQSSLSAELKKYYQKCDPNQHVNFIKRTKMYPVMSEVKHMILAFLSPEHNEITYGLNMLLLFSMNTEAPFLFSQYPNILESVSSFIEHHYPAKTIRQLEYLRTVTLAIRNLLINHKNLQPFLESPLVDVMGKIFENHRKEDQEVIRNITDVFSSLSRIGWDCRELFEMIERFLNNQRHEDLETGIDLLRSLVEQKEEQCEKILVERIEFFSRCLLHSSLQIRESILQIFAYLTEKSQLTRTVCLKNVKFMQRLLALMSTSMGVFQKQAQLSCLIINNISHLFNSENEETRQLFIQFIKPFERKLALISFNDESLSPITSSILFNLSGRVSSTTLSKAEEDKAKILDKMRKNIERDRVSSDEQLEEQEDDEEEDEEAQRERDDEMIEDEGEYEESQPRKKRHEDNSVNAYEDDEDEEKDQGQIMRHHKQSQHDISNRSQSNEQ